MNYELAVFTVWPRWSSMMMKSRVTAVQAVVVVVVVVAAAAAAVVVVVDDQQRTPETTETDNLLVTSITAPSASKQYREQLTERTDNSSIVGRIIKI